MKKNNNTIFVLRAEYTVKVQQVLRLVPLSRASALRHLLPSLIRRSVPMLFLPIVFTSALRGVLGGLVLVILSVCLVRQCRTIYQSRNNICDGFMTLRSRQNAATSLAQLWLSKHHRVAMFCRRQRFFIGRLEMTSAVKFRGMRPRNRNCAYIAIKLTWTTRRIDE